MLERREKIEQPETPEIPPEIGFVLQRHVSELSLGQSGRKEFIRKMGDASFGAMGTSISRSDPPLSVESAILSKGKAKVLVGPNGAGKSTFLDGVMGRDAHIETNSGKGAVVVGGPVHMRETSRVARLDQEEQLANLDEFSAGEVLTETALIFQKQFPIDWEDAERYEENLSNQQVHTRIDTLMSQIAGLFDMRDFLATKVKNLSGGERTKLALFMVLLSEADTFLLDEPTNHLDLRSIAKLTALFKEYKKAGISILSVSHVDWFLRDAGDDGVLEITWDSSGRKLRESGASYRDYIKNPSRERIPVIRDNIRGIQRDYDYKIGQALIAAPGSFTILGTPLIDIEAPLMHGGELVILSGDNGSGKTLMIETISRNTREGLPQKLKGVKIAYLPQFWPEQVVSGTVGDFFQWVKDVANPLGKGSAEHPEQNPTKLFLRRVGELGFGGVSRAGENWLRRPFMKLSGGEQRILWFIAVSSLRDIDMLALDEPTNHMDISLQEKVTHAIRSFPGAILLSTHDKNLIEALSHDSGKLQGRMRKPTHFFLTKKEGKSKLTQSKESPADYMARVMKEAIQQAKKFRV